MLRNGITPENITQLTKNQVFVFGSNLFGIHGSGAAKDAWHKFGALKGYGVGYIGQTYAIPTVSNIQYGNRRFMDLHEIRPFVDSFIVFAKYHTELDFLVTKIGCGLGKKTPKDIAPMFKGAMSLENVALPKEFWDILNGI